MKPGDLIRRASCRRQLLLREKSAPAQQESMPLPRPVSRHSSYTALMRSHDRVHTRHIQGR